MSLVKSLGRGLSSSVLRFSLFTLAAVIAFLALFGTPGPLKNALEKSGVYDSLVDDVLKATKQQRTAENIPVERPEIQAAAKAAFTPDFLRTTSVNILDGTYNWLNKKSAQPDFRIDVSGPKQAFTGSLGDYAVNRAKSLPRCTLQQLQELGSAIDPFTVSCLPPGLNADNLRDDVEKEINKEKGFFENPIITADRLSNNEQGQTPFEQARLVPTIFGWLKLAPFLLMVLMALSAAGLILLHDQRRRGIHITGRAFLSSGVILFLFSGLVSILFGQANRPNGSFGNAINNEFQQTVLSIIGALSGTYGKTLMLIGGLYLIIGGVIWIGLKRTEPKEQGSDEEPPEPEPTDPSPTTTEPPLTTSS
jgi:hypothetical protein